MATSSKLTWKLSDAFAGYHAHSPLGMWSIEQKRGKFYLRMWLDRTPISAEQDMGSFPTLAKAKSEASRANRDLLKLDR